MTGEQNPECTPSLRFYSHLLSGYFIFLLCYFTIFIFYFFFYFSQFYFLKKEFIFSNLFFTIMFNCLDIIIQTLSYAFLLMTFKFISPKLIFFPECNFQLLVRCLHQDVLLAPQTQHYQKSSLSHSSTNKFVFLTS